MAKTRPPGHCEAMKWAVAIPEVMKWSSPTSMPMCSSFWCSSRGERAELLVRNRNRLPSAFSQSTKAFEPSSRREPW